MLTACLVVAGLVCAGTSCNRSRSSVAEPIKDRPPEAAEYVAQADQLYAGREDLNNLRRAIILLSQARTADPASFDAAAAARGAALFAGSAGCAACPKAGRRG